MTDAGLTSPLDVRFVARGRVQLLAPLVWRGRYPVTVPAGYVSDGGSKPAIVWPLVGHPYSGSLLPVYVAHDWELDAGMAFSTAAGRMGVRLREYGVGWGRRTLLMTGVWAYVAWRALRPIPAPA